MVLKPARVVQELGAKTGVFAPEMVQKLGAKTGVFAPLFAPIWAADWVFAPFLGVSEWGDKGPSILTPQNPLTFTPSIWGAFAPSGSVGGLFGIGAVFWIVWGAGSVFGTCYLHWQALHLQNTHQLHPASCPKESQSGGGGLNICWERRYGVWADTWTKCRQLRWRKDSMGLGLDIAHGDFRVELWIANRRKV